MYVLYVHLPFAHTSIFSTDLLDQDFKYFILYIVCIYVFIYVCVYQLYHQDLKFMYEVIAAIKITQ